jgi:NTP pyrophosphatase (non-canonical NTP hydrolase)
MNDIDVLIEYPEFVKKTNKTFNNNAPPDIDLPHHLMGLSEEVGELNALFVKSHYTMKIKYDWSSYKEEIGDVLYHIQALANYFDTDIVELMKMNMDKINKRNNNE